VGGLMGVGKRQTRALKDKIETTEDKSFLFTVLLMVNLLQKILKVDICINKAFIRQKGYISCSIY
jgi:hypothetical protein